MSIVYSQTMMPTDSHYKLIFFTPTSHLDQIKTAVFETGAGTYPGGKYAKVCFETSGKGQFMPIGDAVPFSGEMGKVHEVSEVKCEIFCGGRNLVERAVGALLQTHPYEQVAYEVYKIEDI